MSGFSQQGGMNMKKISCYVVSAITIPNKFSRIKTIYLLFVLRKTTDL